LAELISAKRPRPVKGWPVKNSRAYFYYPVLLKKAYFHELSLFERKKIRLSRAGADEHKICVTPIADSLTA
jgi:hypothetical protein